MSSDTLKEIIDIGNNLTTLRYYTIGTIAILFYDYFLTLADEVKYAWHGKKSWVFAIFITNRYLPIGYQILSLYLNYNTTYHRWLCDKTAFVGVLVTTVTVLAAQVVLTLRTYAITGKNRMITSCLCVIAVSQFALGLYLTAYTATRGAEPITPVPLPVYMICFFVQYRSLQIGSTSLSLGYDFLAFSVIVYRVVRSNADRIPIPRLFKIIAQDATHYFLVIFTSHLVLMLFFLFENPRVESLPPPRGTVVFLPVMITRLMLSLKKAASSQENGWSLGEPTTHSTMRFAERQGGVATRHEIRLDTFGNTHEGTQS